MFEQCHVHIQFTFHSRWRLGEESHLSSFFCLAFLEGWIIATTHKEGMWVADQAEPLTKPIHGMD